MLDPKRWFFAKVTSHDILPQDLNDLTQGLH